MPGITAPKLSRVRFYSSKTKFKFEKLCDLDARAIQN